MIKRLISCATAFLLGAFMTLSCYAETEIVSHEVPVPPQIVFLGDSIAAGFGLDGYGTEEGTKNAYADILEAEYSNELKDICTTKMINDAVSGDTTDQLLSHLQNGEFDKDLKDSDAVVISIGGNDILGVFLDFLAQSAGVNSAEDFENITDGKFDIMSALGNIQSMSKDIDKNLEAFDEKIKSVADYIHSVTDGTVIVQTLYNPFYDYTYVPIITDMAKEKIENLNQHISTCSVTDQNQNYIVCDVFTEFSGKGRELTNMDKIDIHPNSEGHKIIAQTLDKTIREHSYTYETEVQVADAPVTEISKTSLWIVVGLFFGGFALIFAAVIVKHKLRK